MKFATDALDIRLSIRDHDVVVDMIPPRQADCQPQCEVLDMTALPADVMAYMDQAERRKR